MVFDPALAPARRPAFLAWYDAQTAWPEAHDYDDPAAAGATPALRAFHAQLAATYPPAPDDGEEAASGTDYTIGGALIYMTFHDWDGIDAAHETVARLAAAHGLGMFEVSSDLAEVWLPDGKGGLRIAHTD